jgi:hypothetical protein
VRSLLSVVLIASGALASAVEAGPLSRDFRTVDPLASRVARPDWRAEGEGAGDALLPGPDGLESDLQDLLTQGGIRPAGDKQEPKPDARLPKEPSGRKNPAVAGFLSAAVPGAGQFYNGSRLGYLFVGVEAAAWIAYFAQHDTGTKKQEQFRAYADAHWDWDRYRDPAFEDCPPNGHSDMGVQDSTLWSLYVNRRNDFYEDIGKLIIYSCGWDTQKNRDIYRDMRDDSNEFLRNARYATTVVFLNHLVSAIHAARGAAKHNAQLSGRTEIDLKWSMTAYNPSARLTLSRYF